MPPGIIWVFVYSITVGLCSTVKVRLRVMAASEERRRAAARKRASVRAQERTRRTLRTPGKVSESGTAGYAAAKVAQAAGKKVAKMATKPPKSSKGSTKKSKPETAKKSKGKRVTCRNCGKVNLFPADRVFKVCTNCGYSLGVRR